MEIKLSVKSKMGQEKNEDSEINSQSVSREQKSRAESDMTRQKIFSQRQQSGAESPSSIRFNRTTSKIMQQPLSHMQQISATQNQISQLIDQLDSKLQSNYHQKQAYLMEAYRQQLLSGHKELTDLKNNNNQQQIKNEMNEKFLQLKKERLQLIQANMFYSNKCQEFKQLLDAKISEGSELQRQVKFLQKQINNSNHKKIQLMSEIYENNSPLKINQRQHSETDSNRIISLENLKFQDQTKLVTNKNQLYQGSTPNKKISLSTHANSEVLRKMALTSNSKHKPKILPNQIPQIDSQVKKIFHQKLGNQNFYTDRSASKNGTILTKISLLHNQNSTNNKQLHKQLSQIQTLFTKTVNEFKDKKGFRKEIPLFKGEQFTDLEKKEIMKVFLSKEQVKQYIYNIIFDKTEDSALFRKKSLKEKFKIVASQKKQSSVQ